MATQVSTPSAVHYLVIVQHFPHKNQLLLNLPTRHLCEHAIKVKLVPVNSLVAKEVPANSLVAKVVLVNSLVARTMEVPVNSLVAKVVRIPAS